jgi:anti-sigma B factor antagonist
MPPRPPDQWFSTEPHGGATVVRLTADCGRWLDDEAVGQIADRLFGLLADEGRRRLVLDLGRVARLDSMLLGKFVALHRRALAGGGAVVFCHLSPELYEVFQTLQLTGFLRICGTEQEALARV